MNNRYLYALAGCLCLLGVGLFLFKTISLKFPLVPDATSQVWDVEARIHFQPSGGPVKLRLFIPQSNNNISITDEQFIFYHAIPIREQVTFCHETGLL